MDLGLKGRTALITGGSKGIGYAIAEMLAAEGCKLILVARNQADLDAAKHKLDAAKAPGVIVHSADLSKEPETRALAAKFPDVDILVKQIRAEQVQRPGELAGVHQGHALRPSHPCLRDQLHGSAAGLRPAGLYQRHRHHH